MSAAGMIEISDDECLKLLRAFEFGRIAFRAGGELEVFPINYHAEGREITFRTAPGTKLAEVLRADDVVFEIDHIGEREAWSVVAHGTARRLESSRELDEAERLPIRPLVPSAEREFVRIDLSRLSGRRFHRGPQPAGEPPVDPTD